MKTAFVNSLINLYKKKPFIFLTGDLGFNMLEPLRDIMGERFINAGCAEQNMVGMAAGMAKTGESVWVYSIAPFLYARAFEQIRNDVCFHNLPVKLVGMGGGYHYGDLGPSHWALEDYGTLLTFPNIKCFIPAFENDISPIIERMDSRNGPSWLRLGRCELSKADMPAVPYAPVRIIGNDDMVSCGPISAMLLKHFPTIISEIPFYDYESKAGLIVEEHVRQGGLGQIIGTRSINAKCFTDGPYGSQQYMRNRAGLTADKILELING